MLSSSSASSGSTTSTLLEKSSSPQLSGKALLIARFPGGPSKLSAATRESLCNFAQDCTYTSNSERGSDTELDIAPNSLSSTAFLSTSPQPDSHLCLALQRLKEKLSIDVKQSSRGRPNCNRKGEPLRPSLKSPGTSPFPSPTSAEVSTPEEFVQFKLPNSDKGPRSALDTCSSPTPVPLPRRSQSCPRVRFSQNLSRVRKFDINESPESVSETNSEDEDANEYTDSDSDSGETLLCMSLVCTNLRYPMPDICGPDSSDKVKVESVYSCTTERDLIDVIIRVSNISYHKTVTIRYTFNKWKSYQEVGCNYLDQVTGSVDRFRGQIAVDQTSGGSSSSSLSAVLQPNKRQPFCLMFAVRYDAADQSFWDNNNGQDYVVNVTWKQSNLPKLCSRFNYPRKNSSKPEKFKLRQLMDKDEVETIAALPPKPRNSPHARYDFGMQYALSQTDLQKYFARPDVPEFPGLDGAQNDRPSVSLVPSTTTIESINSDDDSLGATDNESVSDKASTNPSPAFAAVDAPFSRFSFDYWRANESGRSVGYEIMSWGRMHF